ncbi:MAG TPA: hypothetical protein DCW47_03455 [Lachnospiraceae bacterium]|nr:hypothetical protein [Lachnospiraceae bacterium]
MLSEGKTKKQFIAAIAALVLTGAVCGCEIKSEEAGDNKALAYEISDVPESKPDGGVEAHENTASSAGEGKAQEALLITLEGSDTRVVEGASFSDGNLLISESGSYVLSGSLDNGSVIVDAKKDSEISLILSGVDINSEEEAAICVKKAGRVVLTTKKDTENHLKRAVGSSNEDSDGGKGVIFSRNELILDGDGSLFLETGYKHGIDVKDDLIIAGGTLSVSAEGDGLHSNDSIVIRGGSVDITSKDDGIHAGDEICVEDGRIVITESYEGIEAENIDIRGGELEIASIDDGINATVGDDMKNGVNISGGRIRVVNRQGTQADGIDSNGDIRISGGEITVSLSPGKSNNALDYGIENGGRLLTDGGRLIACGGSVKAESPDEKSAQCSIFCNLEKAVEAPTEVVLRDENGEEVFSGTIPLSFTTMTISCPELTLQKPFILCIGEEQMEITPESTVTVIRPANF